MCTEVNILQYIDRFPRGNSKNIQTTKSEKMYETVTHISTFFSIFDFFLMHVIVILIFDVPHKSRSQMH